MYNYYTKRQLVAEAMEYNRCAVIAKRNHGDRLIASIQGFKERRNTLIKMARAM